MHIMRAASLSFFMYNSLLPESDRARFVSFRLMPQDMHRAMILSRPGRSFFLSGAQTKNPLPLGGCVQFFAYFIDNSQEEQL